MHKTYTELFYCKTNCCVRTYIKNKNSTVFVEEICKYNKKLESIALEMLFYKFNVQRKIRNQLKEISICCVLY